MKGIILTVFVFTISNVQGAFVDPGVVFSTWEGWGSSLAWFGDVLGGLDQAVQDEIISGLFSPDRLNVNILRYTIGGTIPGPLVCGAFRAGGGTESFLDGPDLQYDWTRDPRARKVLLAAKDLGVDVLEAFSNSPPQWMTISKCSKGNSEGGPLYANFDPVNATQFADYLTEVVKHYHDVWNVTFTTLAPFNEPSSGYWRGAIGGQEGCGFERQVMVQVIQALHASLEEKGMSYTKISVADETEINQELLTQETFTAAGIANLYGKVNTHGYSDSGRENRAVLYTVSQKNGHVLWMDEMGWSATPVEDMAQGIALAERIVYDLRNMNPSAWVYWQAMEDQVSGAWGLVDVPYNDATLDKVRYTSGYFAMLQFSKYIKKGYKIVHVSDGNSVAAFDERTNILVIVTVNQQNTDQLVTFDLSSLIATANVFHTRTSSTEQNKDLGRIPVTGEGTLIYSSPQKSVTTFVVENAVISDTLENLVVNGDFESPGKEGWSLLYGTRNDGAINGNYVYTGALSGYLDFNPSELSLIQNVTATSFKNYFLSARIASSSGGVLFGILLNGEQGPEVEIASSRGYEPYGLQILATAGDTISIYVYGTQGSKNAQIDDVVLH